LCRARERERDDEQQSAHHYFRVGVAGFVRFAPELPASRTMWVRGFGVRLQQLSRV
jgi:hypothetical protein